MSNSTLTRLAITAALCAAAAAPQAAEIVLAQSAVDKLVTQALFSQGGRFVLSGGACRAFLERPSVELKEGRIRIRSHLQARLGVDTGAACVGVDLSTWSVVSGRPVASGGSVRLDDLRIDGVDDPTVRLVLESGLLPSLPRAVDIDVLGAVRSMLQGSAAPLQTTVEQFQINAVKAADGRLEVGFDFRLLAK